LISLYYAVQGHRAFDCSFLSVIARPVNEKRNGKNEKQEVAAERVLLFSLRIVQQQPRKVPGNERCQGRSQRKMADNDGTRPKEVRKSKENNSS
jgi:hypothetical protein